jgi:hypothetical protein
MCYDSFKVYAVKNNESIYQKKTATIYEIHLITVQTVSHDFQLMALLIPNKILLLAESFQVF